MWVIFMKGTFDFFAQFSQYLLTENWLFWFNIWSQYTKFNFNTKFLFQGWKMHKYLLFANGEIIIRRKYRFESRTERSLGLPISDTDFRPGLKQFQYFPFLSHIFLGREDLLWYLQYLSRSPRHPPFKTIAMPANPSQ